MDEKRIRNLSLESLGRISSVTGDEDITYNGCFLAYRDSSMLRKMEIFKYPCRINAFIAILCIRGSTRIIHNLQRYTVNKYGLFISMPNSIIQIESWDDCEIYITAIDEENAGRMAIDFKKAIQVYVEMKNRPYIRLTPGETDGLLQIFYNTSNDLTTFRGEAFDDEIMSTSMNLSVYKFFSIISKYQGMPGISDHIAGRQEEYYNKFMHLLDRNFKSRRKLGFYASNICISPKYLSSLIKKMSGRTAAEWINGIVILEAKHLLKYSRMSIQEISESLHFPNQSFFSQYFRRETGVTPTFYRKEP